MKFEKIIQHRKIEAVIYDKGVSYHDANSVIIPMSVQCEPNARRFLAIWRGGTKAQIRTDLQQVINEPRGPKDQRIRLILKAI